MMPTSLASLRWTSALVAAALGCGSAASPSVARHGDDPPRTGWRPDYVKLSAGDGDPNQNVGMVFRVRGTWLAALALPDPDSAGPGMVYLFEKSGERWERRQHLVAPDGHPADHFGLALALAGSTLVVGAPAQRDRGVEAGVVHVFERRGGPWARVATLSSPDPVERGGFGHHVAIDGDSIVVGEDRTNGKGWPGNRAVYTFARRSASWQHEATIAIPKDLPAPRGTSREHGFGYHVDLDGSSLAIGVPGGDVVLLYERRGDAWIRHQTLEHPSGRLSDPDARGASFGRTLDLDGDVLVVGALRADGDVPDAGAAYVYRRLQGAWHLEDRLIARDGATNDMFGHWVAHDRGLIVSGAFRHRAELGAAYLFARRDGDWQLRHTLIVPDDPQRRNAAYTVDLDGGTAVLSGGRLPKGQAGGFYVLDVSSLPP